MLIVVLLGAAVGVVLGLTGAGGGILAIPALMAGLGWEVQQAAPLALLAVAIGAAVGAVEGLFKGLVRYRAALLMALAGAPFTAFGAVIAQHVPGRLLSVLFAGAMLIVAARAYRSSRNSGQPEVQTRAAPCTLNPATGRLHWTPITLAAIAGVGAFTGFLSGLLGVGGGFVIVPALRRLTNLSMHAIVATSLLVIALVGSSAVASTLMHGATIPLKEGVGFVLAAAVGMLGGRLLIHRMSPAQVQLGFASLVALVAGGMLFKALWL
ncbi:sulfite exporter TauE/SafE family protein [Crenobacter sp. SG2303]|uniref:Probable membrane transporter protein n=1 Tax=Crenobacter oryzisoli TaxID=3056844 RepID=A0ABT7XN16_9NEIS|nr:MULTISPECIES: sulfite exporter TauE/SafE family protein [unclassified Crenobacter]MDN0075125.1 sulfite exporter TauE/SafE family protein [Crenobacter sp. SG2303]MDN0084677.1 sulfite exporter TauE/SafE family protein [Crenobacter sp. SG2305]